MRRGVVEELCSAMILWVVVRSLMAEAAVFRRELDQLFEYLAREVIRERPGRRYPRSPAERRKLQVERAERERRRFRIPRPSRTPVVRRKAG